MAEHATLTTDKIKSLQKQLATDIKFGNLQTANYANKKCSMEPLLKEGDKVYLLQKHIKTQQPSTKLDFKKLGPFEITKKIGPVNFKLKLLDKSKLHPVFHVSLLEPVKGNTPIVTNEEPQLENKLKEYKVKRILKERKRGRQRKYLIKWQGYNNSENTWEPTKNLNCPDLLEEFRQQGGPGGKRPGQRK